MRKGLTQTLLTVAVALLGYQAMALAPTIGTIPDVIIGDAEAGSASNEFVFPDAFDITTRATDDSTDQADILWSYSTASTAYRINDRDDVATIADAVLPANDLTAGVSPADDDPDSSDSNLATLTFRNVNYSPIGGSNTDPAGSGIMDGAVVTFFASDGTTSSQADIMVYTNDDGPDSLSNDTAKIDVQTWNFTTGMQGWTSFTQLGGGNHAQNASGLCMYVPLTGDNIRGWENELNDGQPYTSIPFDANSVYHARLSATAVADLGDEPAWTFEYEQFFYLYGGIYIFYDNGTQNAVQVRGEFNVYFAPTAIGTTKWQTQIGNIPAAERNFHIKMRMNDNDSGGYGANLDEGTICWSNIELSRYPYSSMQTVANAMGSSSLQQAPAGSDTQNDNNWSALATDATTVAFSGGNLVLTPPAGTWQDMVIQVRPGNMNGNFEDVINGTLSQLVDDYPIDWVSDKLYQVSFELSSATPEGAPGFIFVGADVLSSELICNNYSTNKYGAAPVDLGSPGMPDTGAGQNYVAFFYTHNETQVPEEELHAWRPRLDVGTNSGFDIDTTGGSALSVLSYSVDEVRFQ